jgi:E3 ubiquitin-protein ligase BRE1
MKLELDEHSLELRVKAANEAEAACQQRLAAAKAEISEHRYRLDDSERSTSTLKIYR